MSDRLEKETIKKLTSVASVLKNPFKNLEEILTQLGELDKDLQNKKVGEYEKELESYTVGKEARRALIAVEEEYNNPSGSLNKSLSDLGEMFKVCGICGNGTIKDEMISGVCFDCYREGELIHAQNKRIGVLEAQIRDMETKLTNSSSRDYMSDIIDEILVTIRKDIEDDLESIKNGLSSAQTSTHSPSSNIIQPPPPPPSGDTNSNEISESPAIDFSKMTLEELKHYTPEFLSELPLSRRNQYNARLKELQLLKKMTPKQKKEYFRKKKKEQEQAEHLDELKDSLKNLSESDNPLFFKMKQQAEKSVLAGQGTLGNLGLKKVFVYCHKCNTTNKIIEGRKSMCKKCSAPLV